MIRRYRVWLLVPDRNAGTYREAFLGARRTIEAAVRLAERVLVRHPTVETRQRPERWPYFCNVLDGKRGPRGLRMPTQAMCDRLWAPIHIVPSVGETGVTP